MSKVDKQVVEMQFKNQQFESGAKKTISTLDKLKQALTFNKVSDNFGEISKSANSVDMSALIKAVDTIKNRFSTLGIIGMTVISNLTTAAMNGIAKVVSQIQSGGLTRALNIEQAKFMFEGLGMDIEKSMASANAAVKGTAYGLDSAAKAASQLGASGMRAGEDMTTALRAIAGVAAMTGSEFDDIANIFVTVAGNGRLMGDQLLQFSGRGINAAAELAKALGKSETEIRDMVSHGEISFEMFYKAMDNAFGAHAKDANKTFNGALSNMKAALNRIGADVYTPALTNLRDVFNALTPVIDKVHEALNPLISDLARVMGEISKFVVSVLNNLDMTPINNALKIFSILFNAAVDGVKNTYTALMGILIPIKEAFLEVFPPVTAQQAQKLANSIRYLTYQLRITDEQGEGVKNTFSSIFGIFKNVYSVLSQLVKGIIDLGVSLSPILSIFSRAFSIFLEFVNLITGFIADSKIIQNVFTVLASSFGILSSDAKELSDNALTKLHDKLLDVAYAFKGFLDKIDFKTIQDFILPIIQGFKNLFTILGKVGAVIFSVIKGIAGIITSLAPVGQGFLTAAGGIGTFINKILECLASANVLENILSGIGNALTFLKDKIDGFFSSLNAGDIGSGLAEVFNGLTSAIGNFFNNGFDLAGLAKSFNIIFGSGIFAVIGVQLAKLAKNITDIVGAIKDAIGDLNSEEVKKTPGLLDSLKDSLSQLQETLKVGTIVSIAISIGILALALDKLSKINTDDLVKALAAMAVGFKAMMVSMNSLVGLVDGKELKGLSSAAVGMIAMSIAIVILSKAIKNLSQMNVEELVKGLGSVAIALFGFVKFAEVLETEEKSLISAGIAMNAIAISMITLGAAVAIFGSMDLKSLAKGLASVAALLVEISLFLKSAGNSLDVLQSAGAIFIMAGAIGALAISLRIIGSMPLENLAKGLIGIGGALIIMAGAMEIMSEEKCLKGANAILICSAALLVLAPALRIIGSMSIQQIAIALGALAATFIVFGIAGYALEPVVPVLLTLSQAIALFGVAVLAAGVGVAAFGVGLTTIAAALTALGAGASVALTALISLIPMVIEQFGIGIQKLLGVIAGSGEAIFGAVTTIITSILDAIVAIAPQLLETVTVLVQTFCEAIVTNLPTLVETGMFMLITFLQGISDNIYQIATLVGQIITGFITALGEQLPDIIQAGFEFILNFINGLADSIRTNMPLLIEAVINLATSVIDGVVNAFTGGEGSITDTLWGIIQTAVDGIGDFFGNFLENGGEIINNIVQGIGRIASDVPGKIGETIEKAVSKIGEFFGRFLDKGKEIINNIKNGIANVAGKIWDGIKDAIQGAIDNIANFGSTLLQAGKDIIQGIIDGITSMAGAIADGVTGVIGGAVDAFKSFLGIASPSKLFYVFGRFIDMGLANGLKDYAKLPEESTKTMSGKLVSMMSNAIDKVNSLAEDIDLNPTITPVLDVTSFNKSLDSMLSTSKTIAIGSTAIKASRAFFSGESSSSNKKTNETVNSKIYQFTQNNYSPKALNRSEIYRQTNNQFARFKEMSAV